MDPFAGKEITVDQLKTVTELVTEMKKLGAGNGYKKDAKLSKVKSEDLKASIMAQADTIEAELSNIFPDSSILVMLEVAHRMKKKYTTISRELLPTMLSDIGLNSLELSTGEKIVIKDKLEASIADKNYMLARINMIKEGVAELVGEKRTEEDHTEEEWREIIKGMTIKYTEQIDSLFKKQLVIEDPSDELKEELLEKGVMYDNKYSIHWQTLRKYCSEQKAQGRNIPEGITVFEYTEAELK